MSKINEKFERKYNTLLHVVDLYISTELPISSKMVENKIKRSISSATIRNIMAELEEEGYISQLHTSSGRVPTNKGYRYYVNKIKDNIQLRQIEARKLEREYNKCISSIEEIIKKTSFLISRELHSAGLVMWPSTKDLYLKRMECVKLKAETILVVLVTMTNAVKKYIFELDKEIEKLELIKISNFINSNYTESSLLNIYRDIEKIFEKETEKEQKNIINNSFKIIAAILKENIIDDVYLEGFDYFIDKVDSKNISIIKHLLHIFSQKQDLCTFLRSELPYEGLNIYIGEENVCNILKECSLITCGYTLHGKTVGRIGVIGSTRMNYSKALLTMKYLSDIISDKLREIND